ncbi:MAG TPA: ATP-binding protein [Saprospiraceae bacterium]|nr:ATP-binding protein [Saprospiraceae bacterium]
MYFITYGGLSVYDGVVFKNYNQQDGLAHELVNDIIELGPDSMLVATNAGHLNTLIRGKVSPYNWNDNIGHIINKFLQSEDGHLYGVADDGLFIVDDHRLRKIPLYDSRGKDIGTNLYRITEWKGFLFITPWNYTQTEKLIIYDTKNQKVAGIITDQIISNTAVTLQGELWLSNINGIQTLDLHSLQEGKIVMRPVTSIKNADQLINMDIYFDGQKGMWFYKDNEIIHITPSGKVQNISVTLELKASRISDLMVDREGITWMASDGNGVIKMQGTELQILGDLTPGVGNNVPVVYQKNDTTWLFNNTNQSFYRIHKDEITAFPLSVNTFHVANFYIHGRSLCFISDNKLFSVDHKDYPDSYATPKLIFPIDRSHPGIGAPKITPDDFLILYVQTEDTTYSISVFTDNQVVMNYKLSFALDQMSFDTNGNLWVPTRDQHLYEFSLHPEDPDQYIQLEHDYVDEIEDISPRSIAIDTLNNVWIGTRNNGIYLYRFENHKLVSSTHFTTDQGLTDNFYYYLYCDYDNNIWGASQTGLDKISLKNEAYVIENITKSKNIYQGVYSVLNISDKAIWSVTTNGEIILISLDDPRQVTSTPSFFITSLLVNDKEIDISDVHFKYDENNLSIRVAAPSFMDEKSILYSYQLSGSGNPAWSKPSNTAQFNFLNLSPGAYQLNVKAEFPGAMYPPQTLLYVFTIKPPFWRTWWFVLSITIFLIAMLTLAVRYYFSRKLENQRLILENKQAMEKERTRIATDMHDDLGAGLTRIKFLSETIGFRKQKDLPVEEEIESIRANAHDMIDKMGEIVWALNEKNDSLIDLLGYTRAYAVAYLSENGITSAVAAPDDFTGIVVSGEFRRNIYLVVKEALHNIVKHAQASQVTISFEISKNLVIRIKDDGIGFDPVNIRPYSNGVLNMKKRMTDIDGWMEINNDQGTTIILSVPLPS